MSCKYRKPGQGGTFKCDLHQGECQIKVNTPQQNEDNCELKISVKDA